ncbi:MAG: hypothetical protein R2734_08700 [Nocardioides sp.]
MAVTCAGVAVNPLAVRIRTERFKTLVILDRSTTRATRCRGGEAVLEAFGPATRRLALTGTPFRSDVNPIPFVSYEPDLLTVSRARWPTSPTATPRRPGRPRRPPGAVPGFSGDLRWRTRAGDEGRGPAGRAVDQGPCGPGAANGARPGRLVGTGGARRGRHPALSRVRRHVLTRAGWRSCIFDQDSACLRRAAEADQRRGTHGGPLGEKAASRKIAQFTENDRRWMVAVRMVSEGGGVPASPSGSTPRRPRPRCSSPRPSRRFVRARTRGETASVFLPSVA